MVYAIHFAKIIKFSWPLTTIINKDKLEYLVFTNYFFLQKFNNHGCDVVKYKFGFTPLGIMVNGHYNVLVAILHLQKWSNNVQFNSIKQVIDRNVLQVLNIISNISNAFHHLAFFACFDHHPHLLHLIVPIKSFIDFCKGRMMSKMPNLVVHFQDNAFPFLKFKYQQSFEIQLIFFQNIVLNSPFDSQIFFITNINEH